MSKLELKFKYNMPKLQNQKSAVLVAVFQDMTMDILKNKFPDLLQYDTYAGENRFFDFNPKKEDRFLLCLFVGDSFSMFSTLRKQNEENISLYCDSIGATFDIVIEEEAK